MEYKYINGPKILRPVNFVDNQIDNESICLFLMHGKIYPVNCISLLSTYSSRFSMITSNINNPDIKSAWSWGKLVSSIKETQNIPTMKNYMDCLSCVNLSSIDEGNVLTNLSDAYPLNGFTLGERMIVFTHIEYGIGI